MTAVAAPSSFPFDSTTTGSLPRTTCQDPGVTWWTNADGLDPCEQYQQLRGTCDTEYALRPLALDDFGKPTDACNAARDDCCCTSVAFTLSMLCLNCQRSHLANASDSIDAAPDSYQHYTRICYTPLNGALSTAVQGTFRASNLQLAPFLFLLVPLSGEWHGAAVFQQRALGNSSLANTVSPTAVARPWGPGNVVATRTQLPQRLRVLVGALLGVFIVLVSLAALAYALYRRRRDQRAEREYMAQVERQQQQASRARRSRRPRSDRATVGHGSETGEVNVASTSRPTLVSSFRPLPSQETRASGSENMPPAAP